MATMHPRPFYRSRLFWLGLPGLVFLLWAWGRSNLLRTRMFLPPGWVCSTQGKLLWYQPAEAEDRVVTVDYREGDLSMTPDEYFVTRNCFPPPRGHTTTEPLLTTERRWFPPPRSRSEPLDADSGYRFFSLPYWMLTSSYLGVWLGGVCLWQRRKARLMKLHTAP